MQAFASLAAPRLTSLELGHAACGSELSRLLSGPAAARLTALDLVFTGDRYAAAALASAKLPALADLKLHLGGGSAAGVVAGALGMVLRAPFVPQLTRLRIDAACDAEVQAVKAALDQAHLAPSPPMLEFWSAY